MIETTQFIEGAGGGGCFPAGTKVSTPTGPKNIEDIQVGDLVYAFDIKTVESDVFNLPGRVILSRVTDTFKHSFGEVGYTSKLLVIKHEDGELVVTGNHYILTPSRQSEDADEKFARADELQVGDILYTQYGAKSTIISIEEGDEYDFVYNLEVANAHTYIAGKIRVHNGGGGKSNSPRAAVQAPNSVRTNQVARVLNLVSEGETFGPWDSANPAKSIFFDNTPLQNSDGSYNYTNVSVDTRVGTPSQTVIKGFSAVESEHIVNQTVTTSAAYTRTLSSTVDAARITIEFPNGLQEISNTTGDANGTRVDYKIYVRVTAGTWILVVDDFMREMSSGPFQVAYRVNNPVLGGGWEFKVERETADSTSNYLINTISVRSYTEIQDVQLSYDNRALYGLTVGADSTNNRIPTMAADWKGILCSIPDNYDPDTKVYTGSWGGNFASSKEWTDNPVWLLLELIKSDRFGLGEYIDTSLIDVYSFYDAAVYCDELIDDGLGTSTFENRFTFNAQLMVREDPWKTLQAIASTFRGNLYVHNGYIRLGQDRPTTATRIIGNSQVENGLFVRYSSDSDTRYTACNATYTDITDNDLPKTISETADSSDITRFGYNVSEIVSYGTTSEGQARRDARWTIDTSLNNTDIIEFVVTSQYADFEPFEVFKVMDTDYAQVTQEGRLQGVSGTTITLDQPITITTGTWTIQTIGSDGESLETRTITNSAGTYTVITISSSITGAVGTPYIISGAISPRQFRCVSCLEVEPLKYKIKGVEYDPDKYDRVEFGIVVPEPVYWQQPSLTAINAPTSLVIAPQTSTNPDGLIVRFLNVSWTKPADNSAAKYRISWRKDGGFLNTAETILPFARFDASVGGTYEFYVNAINASGVTSPTLSGSYTLDIDLGTGSGIGTPTSLILVPGTSFESTLQIQWNAPANVFGYTLKDYKVELQVPSGAVFKTFYTTSTNYTYSWDQNVADGGPRNSIKVNVYARDTSNKTGSGVTSTFTAGGGPNITYLQVPGGGTTFSTLDLDVEWTALTGSGAPSKNDPSFGYFKVEVFNNTTLKRTTQTTESKYTYTFSQNVQDNGLDTPLSSIIIKVTAYNNLSVAGTTASATFTPIAPPTPSGLYVVNTANTTFIANDLEIEWTCNNANGTPYTGSNLFKEYRVRAYNGVTLKRTEVAATNKYSYDYFKNQTDNSGSAIRTPVLEVTARSVYNVYGTPASATFSNAAPSAPNVTTTPGVDMIFINAVRQAADIDIEGYEYHISTSSGFTPSGSAAGTGTCVYAGPNSSISYKVTGGSTYYVKVAAYDGFGQTGLNYSTQTNGAVSTPLVFSDYAFVGFTFTPNTPSSNKITWSAGTAQQTEGTGSPASYSVTSNNATWSSGSLYIYWDKASPTILQSTTSITTATGADKRVLAVYKGGTDISPADGKIIIDGTTNIFPGTISAPSLVVGSAVITAEAQMGTATVNNAAIKNLVVTSGKIADLTINSLKLANGSVSDTRFYTSNTSTILTSTSSTGTFTVAALVVGELAITTPNPTGLTGPFPTYIHASLITNTRVNGNITGSSGGGIGQTITQNYTVIGTPSWQLRVIRTSNSVVVAQTDLVQNGSGVRIGNITGSSGGGIGQTITQNINISGGAGLNLLFLSPNLAANTAYKIQLVVSGSLSVPYNSAGTPTSLTADQRAIYYQCLLR